MQHLGVLSDERVTLNVYSKNKYRRWISLKDCRKIALLSKAGSKAAGKHRVVCWTVQLSPAQWKKKKHTSCPVWHSVAEM